MQAILLTGILSWVSLKVEGWIPFPQTEDNATLRTTGDEGVDSTAT